MELNEKELVVTDEDGNKVLLEILFTYEHEERGKKYVFCFEKDSPEEIMVFEYTDAGELFEVTDDEEYQAKVVLKTILVYIAQLRLRIALHIETQPALLPVKKVCLSAFRNNCVPMCLCKSALHKWQRQQKQQHHLAERGFHLVNLY